MVKKILFLVFLNVATFYSWAVTTKFRATWRSDPSTTIVIGWEQVSGTDAVCLYRKAGKKEEWKTHIPDRTIHFKDMTTSFARLQQLEPDTRYEFFIRDSEGKSRTMAFHTSPDHSEKPLTFICGGDSRNNRDIRRYINRLVARMQPFAICFSGDMTDLATAREWKEWLDDWQLTITSDGRLLPIIPARGNHEPDNRILVDLFDCPHPENYYALGFGGDLLRIYTLNSMAPVYGKQTEWLKNDLETKGCQYTWRMAQYHYPIRPHQRSKREANTQYDAWTPLFYEYQVQLAQESDAHVAKITWPLRPEKETPGHDGFIRDDQKGTIYIGEGGWGAPLRKPDKMRKWTRQAGSFHHFNLVVASKQALKVYIIDAMKSDQMVALPSISTGNLPSGAALWQIEGASHIALNIATSKNQPLLSDRTNRLPVVQARGKRYIEVPYRLSSPAKVEIRLLGHNADLLSTLKMEKNAGMHISNVPVSHLPEGLYYLEVLANGLTILQRQMER